MPTHVAKGVWLVSVPVLLSTSTGILGVMSSKKKQKRVRNDYEEDLEPAKPKKVPKTLAEKDSERRLIVILENACLETIKVLGEKCS